MGVVASTSPDSVFLFRFRLLPTYACSNLNFDRLSIPPAMAVCTRDVLGLQLSAPQQELGALLVFAKDRGSALLDAHAYCSYPDLPALELLAESWLEVKETGPRNTVFGYADASLDMAPLIPGHADNRPFSAAAELLPTIDMVPGLGAAFATFRAARRQSGSYVAFFAYRVLEDVAYTFEQPTRIQAWTAMNTAFGTSKDHWQLLIDAGPIEPPME